MSFNNSCDVEKEKKGSNNKVDKVRRDFSKKLADCLVDNTRLTAEVENLRLSNNKQAARIIDLNNRIEGNQACGESKTFFSEYETAKADLVKAEDEISGKNDCITALRDSLAKLENESDDKKNSLPLPITL